MAQYSIIYIDSRNEQLKAKPRVTQNEPRHLTIHVHGKSDPNLPLLPHRFHRLPLHHRRRLSTPNNDLHLHIPKTKRNGSLPSQNIVKPTQHLLSKLLQLHIWSTFPPPAKARNKSSLLDLKPRKRLRISTKSKSYLEKL